MICLLTWVCVPAVAPAQISSLRPFKETHALVVGVSDYADDKLADLPYADDDAAYFAELLRNGTDWPVASENIVLLINEDATFGRFVAELNALSGRVAADDRVILFFAGHGDVESVSEVETGYLLFHDAPTRAYAAGGACEVNTLDQNIEQLILNKGAEVILIADACRSGSLAGRSTGSAATASALEVLFENTAKLLSCQPEESSLESPELGGGHGLFSYYLVQGMRGAANQDDNAYVSLLELERYLQDQVRADSDNRQTPSVSGKTSLKLTKTKRQAPSAPVTEVDPTPTASLTTRSIPYDPTEKFLAFNAAVARKHFLFPEEGSAYQIYQSMGDGPAAVAFKPVMKTALISGLQNDPQRALSEYLNAPGRELAKRWVDSEAYVRYPDHLDLAATLLGEDDYFYDEITARAHYFRGVNLRLRTELADADTSLLQRALREQQLALSLLPKGRAPHVYNELGLIYQSRGQIDKAIGAYQEALEQSPRWVLPMSNLGLTYVWRKRFAEAEALYQKAILEAPDLSVPYYNLANLHEANGQYAQAVEMYQNAITKPDPVAEAYYNLALICLRTATRDLPLAEASVQRYLELCPEDVYAYLVAAAVSKKQDRLTDTWEMLNIAQSLAPHDWYVLQDVARTARSTGKPEIEIESWEKAVEHHPEKLTAKLWLARAYADNDNSVSAIATLRSLFEAGFDDYTKLDPSGNFPKLTGLPEFIELVSTYFSDED